MIGNEHNSQSTTVASDDRHGVSSQRHVDDMFNDQFMWIMKSSKPYKWQPLNGKSTVVFPINKFDLFHPYTYNLYYSH